ncbi:hypothetical protein ACTXT7_012222 [Hymenolepis weldensis]
MKRTENNGDDLSKVTALEEPKMNACCPFTRIYQGDDLNGFRFNKSTINARTFGEITTGLARSPLPKIWENQPR